MEVYINKAKRLPLLQKSIFHELVSWSNQPITSANKIAIVHTTPCVFILFWGYWFAMYLPVLVRCCRLSGWASCCI